MTTLQRLFDPRLAFEHPVTVGVTAGVAGLLLAATVVVFVLNRTGRLSEPAARELKLRIASWWVLPAPPAMQGAERP